MRIARVPSHFQAAFLTDIGCQMLHLLRSGITTHKTETSDLLAILLQQRIHLSLIQDMTNIIMQMRTMTVLTPMRTIRNVDRQSHLIRNFLENDIEVIILKSHWCHFFIVKT